VGKLKHCVGIICVHLEDLHCLLAHFSGLICHYLVSKLIKKKKKIKKKIIFFILIFIFIFIFILFFFLFFIFYGTSYNFILRFT
jgi:predicted PurR-regulated permease PerM